LQVDGESKQPKDYELSSIHATPYPLRREHILDHYRVFWSARACARSFFMLHNESLNVWTHFIGFLFFLCLMIKSLFLVSATAITVPPAQSLTLLSSLELKLVDIIKQNEAEHGFHHSFDFWMMGVFFAGTQVCFLFSSIYHLFACQSLHLCKRFTQLDYFGINVFISCCLMSSIYFGFYCHPEYQAFYVGVSALFSLLTTAFSNLPVLLSPAYSSYRITAFFGHVSFSLIPLVHWVILEGYHSYEVQNVLWRIIFMFGMFGLAFVFYITKFPERLSPGRFDLFLNSHQIWHIISMLAAYWQYHSLVFFMTIKYHKGCSHVFVT